MASENTFSTSSADTLLLVEDDTFISQMLQKKFVQAGYTTLVAHTTAQADIFLKQQPVDMILLDIILPDENGFSFLERIKKDSTTKNIPVMILSNLDQASEEERGKKLGAIDFLVKAHHSPSEIVEKVRQVLGR